MIFLLIFIFILNNDISWSIKPWTSSSFSLKSSSSAQRKNDLLEYSNNNYLKTGTTIVGINLFKYCNIDCVILAADTRSTSGKMVMDKNKMKIHCISPCIFSCAAGTSADCEQLTRRASHLLALDRLESDYCEKVSVVKSYLQSLLIKPVNGNTRMPSAVFLLGGVDRFDGASLYQIDSSSDSTDSIPHSVNYAALGSGSLDAIAIIESELEYYKKNNITISINNATNIVRNAVRAGILNDMGSGSHVDICVIQLNNVEEWREEMIIKRTPHITKNNNNNNNNDNDNNNVDMQQIEDVIQLKEITTINEDSSIYPSGVHVSFI